MADAKVAQSVRGGVTSERKLVDELRMHLAWRWFTGLALASWTPEGLLALHTS